MPAVKNVAVAAYCADPDVIAGCLKLCSDPGVSAIGLRLGSYLQAVAFFAMTLLAPDEGGAESMWVALSIGYSFIATAFVQLWLGNMTSHHATVVFLLAMLPYIGTMANMNSITAYRGLGAFGMRALQFGLLVKTIFAGILWGLIVNSFFNGQPPKWMGFEFRQPGCFKTTAIVSFLVPIRPDDDRTAFDTTLIVIYSIFWFMLLLLGSNWTLRAPTFLRRNGEPVLGYHYRHHYFAQDGSIRYKRANMKAHPQDYTPDNTSDDEFISFRSLPKSNQAKPVVNTHSTDEESPQLTSSEDEFDADSHDEKPSATDSTTHTPPGPTATPAPKPHHMGSLLYGANSWSHSKMKAQTEFYVWPAVAVLLVFTIASVELQIGLNDIYEGEMEFDFPGTLSMLLTVPTIWAAFKAARLIYIGNRPSPTARTLENFYELEADAAAGEEEKRQKKRERWRLTGGMRHLTPEKRDTELGRERDQRRRLGKMRRRRHGVRDEEVSSSPSDREHGRHPDGGVTVFNF